MDNDTRIVLLSVLSGFGAQLVVPLFRHFFGYKIADRKIELHKQQVKESNIDSSFKRLERENIRLNEEMDELRKHYEALQTQFIDVKDKCTICENFVRMMGRRKDLDRYLKEERGDG